VFAEPAHPYTRALIKAFPNIEAERYLAASIPGNPPNLLHPPAGCRFHERCSEAINRCSTDDPQMTKLATGHSAACYLLQGRVKV
jgi:peptide/nickel transport system ATP-binding protein